MQAMSRERLRLSPFSTVETGLDHNGRHYVVYASGASAFLRSSAEARKWLRLPPKIPSREAFDSWVASLEAADAERDKKKGKTRNEPGEGQQSTGLAAEIDGLDESDPNCQTKPVI